MVAFEAVGALCGVGLVGLGTAIQLGQNDLSLTFPHCLAVQGAQPLLWIIDTAPLILGYAAYLAGKRDLGRFSYSATLQNLIDETRMELGEKASFTQAIFDNSGHAILATDPNGIITAANPAASKMLGYEAGELVGQDMCVLHDPDEILRLGTRIALASTHEDSLPPTRSDVVFIRKDGKRITLELTSGAQYAGEKLIGFFEIGIDVSAARDQATELIEITEQLGFLNILLERQHADLALANSKLEESALVDDLTGVNNKRHFDMRLDNMVKACVREGVPMSLLMLDVDRFKLFNDSFGHTMGDRVLKAIGCAIRSVCRPGDLPARVGGEEFAVLMPLTDSPTAYALAENLRGSIEAIEGLPHGVTASIGVAPTCTEVLTAEALYVAADKALYEAKRIGRNCVAQASSRDDQAA